VKWVVRVDDRALSGVAALHPPPPVDPRISSEPDRIRGASFAVSIGIVGLAYAWLVRRKSGANGADRGGVEADLERPVLPLPLAVRSTLSGASLALGIALQVSDEVSGGSACVAIAIVAAALRPKAPKAKARGPGRWLVLRPCDAFAAWGRPSDWLDLGSPSGRITALLVGTVVVVLILALRNVSADAPWLVGMDAVVFVPLWIGFGWRPGLAWRTMDRSTSFDCWFFRNRRSRVSWESKWVWRGARLRWVASARPRFSSAFSIRATHRAV
jgi:hypothetical protein